jgi:hypothetical protein
MPKDFASARCLFGKGFWVYTKLKKKNFVFQGFLVES